MTTATDLKIRFQFYVNQYDQNRKKPAALVGAALGIISKAAGGDANRKLVQKALCGKTSSREMSDAELYALCVFAAPDKVGGHWQSNHGLYIIDMCKILLEDATRQEGQAEMELTDETVNN